VVAEPATGTTFTCPIGIRAAVATESGAALPAGCRGGARHPRRAGDPGQAQRRRRDDLLLRVERAVPGLSRADGLMAGDGEAVRSARSSRSCCRDDALVVVDKPAGLIVHRGWADDEVAMLQLVRDAVGRTCTRCTASTAARAGCWCSRCRRRWRGRCRSSGRRARCAKRYLAIVRGGPPDAAVIDHPIPRSEDGPRVPAVTAIRTLHRAGRYAVVAAAPRTGRLHQIRRHLKHISCPLIGDVRYGKGEHNRLFREQHDLHRLALHARSLRLQHPVSGRAAVHDGAGPADLAER
jgi:tRNA pseudouridine65 synthase